MKIGNSVSQIPTTRDIQEAIKQSDKLPETLAPTPDLKVVADPKEQAAKSESAKASSAAQESLIRAELELKYTKPNTRTETNKSTGEQTVNDSQVKEAEERLGNPLEIADPRRDGGAQDSRSRTENSKGEIGNQLAIWGSVYGDSSSGGEVSPGIGGGGGATPEQLAQFDEMAGNSSGPSDATSKRDEINARASELMARARGNWNQAATQMDNRWNRAMESSQKPIGKGMISETSESVRQNKDGSTTQITDTLENGYQRHTESTDYGWYKFEKWESTTIENGKTTREEGETSELPTYGTKTSKTEKTETDGNGNTTVTESETVLTTDSNGQKTTENTTTTTTTTDQSVTTTTTKTTYKPDGSSESSSTTETKPKNAEDGGQWDEQNFDKNKFGNLIDQNWNIRPPKSSGNVDPSENEDNIVRGGELSGAVAQQGKGLISQPVDREDQVVGASGNVSFGGDIDFQEKAGWAGREITEQPGDVDLPGDDPELPPAANQQDEETSTKQSNNALWSQLTYNLQRAHMKR
jgi:hypothetical protein